MPKKIEEVSTITNTYFAQLPDKAVVRVAGVIKKIDDKETSSGTAKRFKGDVAVENGDNVYQGRYGFFPTPIRDALLDGAKKLGKWSSFEFVLKAVKTVKDTEYKWDVSFEVTPRIEQPRVIALLND